MSAWSKLFITVGVMALLGLGLCGVDQLIPASRTQEFGGDAAFFGFALCLLAVLTLVLGSLAIGLARLLNRSAQKP